MIIGCCGSGKTTLAHKIHDITKLPLIHLDQEYWKPDWTEPNKEEFRSRVIDLSNSASWIIDGNYGGTMNDRIERATSIIFLDRSKWICCYRVLKRTVSSYGRTRNDMASKCPERFDYDFIAFVWRFNKVKRPQLIKRLNEVQRYKTVLHLSSESEVNQFLSDLHKLSESPTTEQDTQSG